MTNRGAKPHYQAGRVSTTAITRAARTAKASASPSDGRSLIGSALSISRPGLHGSEPSISPPRSALGVVQELAGCGEPAEEAGQAPFFFLT